MMFNYLRSHLAHCNNIEVFIKKFTLEQDLPWKFVRLRYKSDFKEFQDQVNRCYEKQSKKIKVAILKPTVTQQYRYLIKFRFQNPDMPDD